MKDVRLYLVHIDDCIKKYNTIRKMASRFFLHSELIQDAVYRNFEIIGEAVKRMPSLMKDAYTGVP